MKLSSFMLPFVLMSAFAPAAPSYAAEPAGPPAAALGNHGMVTRSSPFPVEEAVNRLETLLRAKGIKIFARIKFSRDARAAGLSLRPMQLLIFGNPKAGTPLMQAAPTIGLDLPMKVLVWQDSHDRVWATWNAPSYLLERHHLEAAYAKNLPAINKLLDAAWKK